MIVATFIISLLALIVASFAVAVSILEGDLSHNGELSKKLLQSNNRLGRWLIHILKYSFSSGYRRWTNVGLNPESKKYYKH